MTSSQDTDGEKYGQQILETETIQPPLDVDDKAMVRKIDKKVLPMLCVIFMAAFLDR
jgi:hypothetical protein